MRYVYLGDSLTRPELKGMQCDPVRRADGKCIVNKELATAMVVDEQGRKHVVKRRGLRLINKPPVDELMIDGRRYVTLSKAAQVLHYDANTIRYWLRSKPGLFSQQRRKGKRFVCLSDLLAFVKARQQGKSKWQQIADWWNTHVQERGDIVDTYDFYRRLIRDGVQCSQSLARWFISQRQPRVWKSRQVLAWLEADPARRHLSLGEVRRQAGAALRIDLDEKCVTRARKLYDRVHGEHKPPFDAALYLTTKDAAAMYGVSRSLITREVASGKLDGGIHWKDTLYVLQSSLEKRFGNGWLRKTEAVAHLRAWFKLNPQRLDLVASAAHRAFGDETGIRISLSAVYDVRRDLRMEQTSEPVTA